MNLQPDDEFCSQGYWEVVSFSGHSTTGETLRPQLSDVDFAYFSNGDSTD